MTAALRRSSQVRDKRVKIAGSSLLGVFARCTEEVLLAPLEARGKVIDSLEKLLQVSVIPQTIGGSMVIGSLVAGNSHGFVVTTHASKADLVRLSEHGRVAQLPGKMCAAGNIVLANDSAALVHPALSSKACEVISSTLGVPVQKGTIGGLKTVGMSSIATNKGILAHPRLSPEELAVLEDLFQLPVDVGTVNMGSPLVGSGLLANSRGYAAGWETTGPELGRVVDTLGYLG